MASPVTRAQSLFVRTTCFVARAPLRSLEQGAKHEECWRGRCYLVEPQVVQACVMSADEAISDDRS